MRCAGCNGAYEKKSLAKHLLGLTCLSCKGVSFTLTDYLHFLQRSESIDNSLEKETDDPVIQNDTKKALFCSCGQVMSKYLMSQDSDRRVDYCSACQKIWLDCGEWDYLKNNNLHRYINKIFTESYQRNLRLEKTKAVLKINYETRLGTQDYTRLKEIREWINNNQNKKILMAYLNAQDPYSASK